MRRLSLVVAAALLAFSTVSGAHAQQMRTFSKPNYGGTQRVFRDPLPDLQSSRPTTVGSVRLETEKWLICDGTNYSGDCLWVSRDVPSLPALGLSDTPGSIKPERVPLVRRHWGGRYPPSGDSLALFEKANYDGEWTEIKDNVDNFAVANLKSPGSLVLGDGTWRLCTGVDYSGRCLIVTGSAWDLHEIFPGRILSAQKLP
ncbi:MAG: hypothetical protein GC190_17060 [Alphaproteobacteria bacterium]|nr:hypothetical protein [Alphaproteobacteria bacterium]